MVLHFCRFFLNSNLLVFSQQLLREVSKYGVISGPYFPVFGLNTERYGVLRIFSPDTGIYGPEITLYLDTFHAVSYYQD